MTPWEIYLRLHAEISRSKNLPLQLLAETLAQNVSIMFVGAGILLLFHNPYLLGLVRSFESLICVPSFVFAWIRLHDAGFERTHVASWVHRSLILANRYQAVRSVSTELRVEGNDTCSFVSGRQAGEGLPYSSSLMSVLPLLASFTCKHAPPSPRVSGNSNRCGRSTALVL